MAKTEMDMIRDILGWPLSDEQKLALLRQAVGVKPTAKPIAARRKKRAAKAKASTPKPAKVVKRRKRSALRPEGSGYTRRSQLWAELKRLAPDKAKGLSYTRLSTEQIEAKLAEAKVK